MNRGRKLPAWRIRLPALQIQTRRGRPRRTSRNRGSSTLDRSGGAILTRLTRVRHRWTTWLLTLRSQPAARPRVRAGANSDLTPRSVYARRSGTRCPRWLNRRPSPASPRYRGRLEDAELEGDHLNRVGAELAQCPRIHGLGLGQPQDLSDRGPQPRHVVGPTATFVFCTSVTPSQIPEQDAQPQPGHAGCQQVEPAGRMAPADHRSARLISGSAANSGRPWRCSPCPTGADRGRPALPSIVTIRR